MAYEEYQEYEAFKKAFGGGSIDTIKKAGDAIDSLTEWDLENLIHILYGKFTHLPEGKTEGAKKGRLETLRRGVKRVVQTRFYTEIYGHPPAQSVFDRNTEAALALRLFDEPYVPPPKPEKKTPPAEKVAKAETSKLARPPKAAKPKSEFGAKVAGMELADLITWARELGVPEENIDKHKDKPKGLAKMNISNLVRARLPK